MNSRNILIDSAMENGGIVHLFKTRRTEEKLSCAIFPCTGFSSYASPVSLLHKLYSNLGSICQLMK